MNSSRYAAARRRAHGHVSAVSCGRVRSRHAFLNEANLHADKEVCLDVLRDHDFGFVHQVLSLTRTDNDSLTSSNRRFTPLWPSRLDDLVRYGPVYLTETELKQCLETHLTRDYAFLARLVLEVRDWEVFAFQRAKLQELGYPLRRMRLGRAIVSRVLDLVLNPKQSISGAWRRATRGSGRGRPRPVQEERVVEELELMGSPMGQLAPVNPRGSTVPPVKREIQDW